jgi:hypothetical protein
MLISNIHRGACVSKRIECVHTDVEKPTPQAGCRVTHVDFKYKKSACVSTRIVCVHTDVEKPTPQAGCCKTC